MSNNPASSGQRQGVRPVKFNITHDAQRRALAQTAIDAIIDWSRKYDTKKKRGGYSDKAAEEFVHNIFVTSRDARHLLADIETRQPVTKKEEPQIAPTI